MPFQLVMFADERVCFICHRRYVSIVPALVGNTHDMLMTAFGHGALLRWTVGLCSSDCELEFHRKVTDAREARKKAAAWE